MTAYFTSELNFIRVVLTSSEGGILGETLEKEDDMVVGRMEGKFARGTSLWVTGCGCREVFDLGSKGR